MPGGESVEKSLPGTEEPVNGGVGTLPTSLHSVEGVRTLAVRRAPVSAKQLLRRGRGGNYRNTCVTTEAEKPEHPCGAARLCGSPWTQGEPLPPCRPPEPVALRLLLTFHGDRVERRASAVLHGHQQMAARLAPLFPDCCSSVWLQQPFSQNKSPGQLSPGLGQLLLSVPLPWGQTNRPAPSPSEPLSGGAPGRPFSPSPAGPLVVRNCIFTRPG